MSIYVWDSNWIPLGWYVCSYVNTMKILLYYAIQCEIWISNSSFYYSGCFNYPEFLCCHMNLKLFLFFFNFGEEMCWNFDGGCCFWWDSHFPILILLILEHKHQVASIVSGFLIMTRKIIKYKMEVFPSYGIFLNFLVLSHLKFLFGICFIIVHKCALV